MVPSTYSALPIEDLAQRMGRLRACFDVVGTEARAVLQAEYERMLASCPRDQRGSLLSRIEGGTPRDGVAGGALERRLERCVSIIGEAVSNQLDRLQELTSEREAGHAARFGELASLFDLARSTGRVGIDLEESLRQLEITADWYLARALDVAIGWLEERQAALSPESVAAALGRDEHDPDAYARHVRSQFVLEAGKFDSRGSRAIKQRIGTEILRAVREAQQTVLSEKQP